MVLIDRAADGRIQRKEPDWSFFTLDTAPKNLKLRNTLDFHLKNLFGHLKTLKTRLFYFINSSLSLVFNLKAYTFNVNLKMPQSVALPASLLFQDKGEKNGFWNEVFFHTSGWVTTRGSIFSRLLCVGLLCHTYFWCNPLEWEPCDRGVLTHSCRSESSAPCLWTKETNHYLSVVFFTHWSSNVNNNNTHS